MHRLAEYCILASGFRRALLAFLAGALAALALPPLGLGPVLFISLSIAVWLLDGTAAASQVRTTAFMQTLRQAAATGWFFGFGFHLAGLWWLGSAFLVDADKFLWALPLGVVGLPAVLALFMAFGFALARLFWPAGTGRILWFAAALTASEYLRGTILTGFPWNPLGITLGEYVVTAQIASVVGLWGLTLLTVLAGALPAAAVDFRGAGPALRMRPILLALGLVAIIAGFGALRLMGDARLTVPNVKLRIMQPNIPQSAQYDAESAIELVRKYIELSDRATSPTTNGLSDVTHLIWPESPFPFPLVREPRALSMIANALGGHTVLLTGGVRVEPDGPGTFRAWNSLFVLDREGRIVDTYDKVHLVPFGEYLPYSGVLRRLGLRQFVSVPTGFEPGSARRALTVPGLPLVQPLICYEAIFPGDVMPQGTGAARPGVMVNITNDAWFGLTPGPYQHFAQARLRAVEEGVPLVRASNPGISAVVDGYGRVTAELGLGVTGVLDATLPRALSPTVFARFGNLPALLLWLVTAAAAVVLSRRKGARKRA